MHLPSARELDFDRVLQLVAAQTRTRLGRFFLTRTEVVHDFPSAVERAGITAEFDALIEEHGRLNLAGVDDALDWLEDDSAMPLEPADLMLILGLARRTAAVRRRLVDAPEHLSRIRKIGQRLFDTTELVAWAAPRLGRDGRVPDDASPLLAKLRRTIGRSRQNLIADLEKLRRSHSDIVTDAPPTLRRDRYCIPVRTSVRAQLPGLLLDRSGSGATAFVEPFAAVENNNQLAEALVGERQEVNRILGEVAAAFSAVREDLVAAAEELGRIDAVQARVLFGQLVEGRIVNPEHGCALKLRRTRHPLLDERLAALRAEVLGETEARIAKRLAVPLDFSFPDAVHTLVISGPNAGGKTVVLKTIGLMVMMCYHGIPLPVGAGSTVPWFDHVWFRIGDDQDVSADLSTFSGAMNATAELLRQSGPNSLVIYDELGSGTDPLEGAALGCALLEELTSSGCRTVASTHLAAVALSAQTAPFMANGAMDYDEVEGRPTYNLRIGRPGRSRGLEIATSMGVSLSVIDRAKDLLGGQHLEIDRWLQRLEKLEAEVIQAKEEAMRERSSAEASRIESDRLQAKLQQQIATIPVRLQVEKERLKNRAKKRLDRAIEELDQATREHRHLGKKARQKLRENALDLKPPAKPQKNGSAPESLEPGSRVRIRSLGSKGTLESLRGSRARVTVGNKKLWVETDDLETLNDGQAAAPPLKVRVDVEESAPRELMLLGLDSEEARERVERFLDRAHAAGLAFVRIVHGHGTGALRRVVIDAARSHPAVSSFSHPPQNRGGSGATELTLDS